MGKHTISGDKYLEELVSGIHLIDLYPKQKKMARNKPCGLLPICNMPKEADITNIILPLAGAMLLLRLNINDFLECLTTRKKQIA